MYLFVGGCSEERLLGLGFVYLFVGGCSEERLLGLGFAG